VALGLCGALALWGRAPSIAVLALSVGLGAALGAWLDARAALQRARSERAAPAPSAPELPDAETLALREALEQARTLDHLKTEFFDNVSHELRTPLSLILLSVDAMRDPQGTLRVAELGEHLGTLERSSARLLRLINQLLDVAKLEAGKAQLRLESVELGAFLSAVLAQFRPHAQQRGLSLSLSGGPVAEVPVDVEKLEVVFQNLISNAVKFSPDGGQVWVRLRELPDAVEVQVEDRGVGIPETDVPRVFDRFAQADAHAVRRFGGTGIGLALARQTVELHGGTIAVKSQQGEGTTFTVRLPRRASDARAPGHPVAAVADLDRRLAQLRVDPLPPTRARPPSSGTPAPPPGAPKILVVEDDPDLSRTVARILGSRFQVIHAADGEAGLALAVSERPELVLSDLVMPKRSGLQLLEALRATPAVADTPLILLTSRREADAVVEGLSAGANDYIGKPFVAAELLARVEGQLRLREAAIRTATAERLSAVGMLTMGFAHEVRNPLNGLLNAVEPLRYVLQELEAGSPDGEVLLDLMRDCGKRVQKLAESLLGFARPAPTGERVDLAACLESTVQVVGWRVQPKVKLVQDLAARPTLTGDEAALNQVWLNLLDNALRAVGSEGTITVALREVGDEVEVQIRDTGPGIDPAVKANLFQPFFSTRPAGEGTGLGLALSRRIVLAHGGQISAESAPGQGAAFTVRLPKSEAAEAAPARPGEASPPT